MRKACLLLGPALILLLVAGPALAYDTAKSLGMAGAVVAIGDDLSAPYINPAGLANVSSNVAGLSLSQTNLNWRDDVAMTGSDTNILENLGGAMPLGPGVIYAGSATIRGLTMSIDDFDLTSNNKLYAPGVAYGMKVMPGLSLGAGLAYLYRTVDTKDGDSTEKEIGTGLGMNLGALYSVSPLIDLGASIYLPGTISQTGTDKDPSSVDYTSTIGDPSSAKLGAAIKPMQNLTVGLQFDVMSGFAFAWKGEYDGGGDWDEVQRGDSVVITRIGAEYALPVTDGVVPLWAGLALSPDNNFETESTDSLYTQVYQYKIPYATTLALGAGYSTKSFDVGIAAQLNSGTTKTAGGDMTTGDTKVVASGDFKF